MLLVEEADGWLNVREGGRRFECGVAYYMTMKWNGRQGVCKFISLNDTVFKGYGAWNSSPEFVIHLLVLLWLPTYSLCYLNGL